MRKVLLGDLVLSMYEELLLEHCDSEVAGVVCATRLSEMNLKRVADEKEGDTGWHPGLNAPSAPTTEIRTR
jgi:hypothetical protein